MECHTSSIVLSLWVFMPIWGHIYVHYACSETKVSRKDYDKEKFRKRKHEDAQISGDIDHIDATAKATKILEDYERKMEHFYGSAVKVVDTSTLDCTCVC